MADKGSTYLGREELLSGSHFRTHEVDVGGKKLRIRELTAEEWLGLSKEERETMEASKKTASDGEVPAADTLAVHFDRVARLLVKTAVDSAGARLFQDGDEPAIREKLGATTLMDIYKTLAQLGGDKAGGAPVGGA